MHKYSVIIPFRNREEHLSVLVPHLKKYAIHNNIDLEIIIAEQTDDNALRRGALRNEGVRHASGDVIVLHDVDYLPELTTQYWVDDVDVFRPVKTVEFINMDGSSREEHDVPAGYRSFKKSIDDNFFGGVICITKNAFNKINGYNPLFKGWGLEDDEFRERIRKNNLKIRSGVGAFKALPHPDSFKNDELFRANQLLYASREQYSGIGINHAASAVRLNELKKNKYDVDVWLEVTDWNDTLQTNVTHTTLNNIHKLDYGVFALLDNVNHDHVQRTVAEGRRWEPEVMALCERYVKPNSVVVDIGANIGTFSVRLAQLTGPHGSVIAFEPQRIIYQQLCANLFLNKILNVYPYQLALSNTSTSVHLTPIDYTRGAPGEVRIHGNVGEEVNCIALDSLELSNVSLIKMDVERYEPFVFDGARTTIEKNRPVILFELTTLPLPDYPTDYIVTMLNELNYNIYEITEWGDYLAIPSEIDDNS
jgi:FkbM family methyltransferase